MNGIRLDCGVYMRLLRGAVIYYTYPAISRRDSRSYSNANATSCRRNLLCRSRVFLARFVLFWKEQRLVEFQLNYPALCDRHLVDPAPPHRQIDVSPDPTLLPTLVCGESHAQTINKQLVGMPPITPPPLCPIRATRCLYLYIEPTYHDLLPPLFLADLAIHSAQTNEPTKVLSAQSSVL